MQSQSNRQGGLLLGIAAVAAVVMVVVIGRKEPPPPLPPPGGDFTPIGDPVIRTLRLMSHQQLRKAQNSTLTASWAVRNNQTQDGLVNIVVTLSGRGFTDDHTGGPVTVSIPGGATRTLSLSMLLDMAGNADYDGLVLLFHSGTGELIVGHPFSLFSEERVF